MQPQQPNQTREQFIENLFLLDKKRDNIYSDKEARTKLISGIDKTVDCIKSSYGASGSNVVIEDSLYPFHRIVNDGKTIVQSIKLIDSVENMGANIVREVADKSDKESGDGRKTTMILLQAILKEGLKSKEDPMTIKKSLDECLPIILKSIDDQTKEITVNEVGQIASTASESETLGNIFQEIYQKIGKDGIIELDNSGISDTFYDITEGVRLLNCGYQYPYMATEDKGRKAIYNFPYVLITKQKISSIKELDSILRQVDNKGKGELVIFCDDIDMSVSQSLAFLHNGTTPDGHSIKPFKTLVIKAPTLWKDWLFEDFAKITGATIVDAGQGHTLKNFQFSWLGYCDKIISSKDETVVLGTRDISEHIQVLSEQNTDDSKIRIARLKTKTAILKLGANSESELSYVRAKALDARNSCYLALNGGVVEGAGVSLVTVTDELLHFDTAGGQILRQALCYPYLQIKENMDIDTLDEIDNIQDSAIVVKNAVTNALSVASMVLTAKCVITQAK